MPTHKHLHVVWFKRDLRVTDHTPLVAATQTGQPVLPLYILEPTLWQQPDMSGRHYRFLQESLLDLHQHLKAMGSRLTIKIGDAIQIFNELHNTHGIAAIYAHEETGNDWTYARDRSVLAWARQTGIPVLECQNNGVIRRLKNRDGWATRWTKHMQSQPFERPTSAIWADSPESSALPAPHKLGIAPDILQQPQAGGQTAALTTLHSFLWTRGLYYAKGLSSPLTASEACSRLSPYLAFGCLSMREVLKATQARASILQADPPATRGAWPRALRAFEARLHWHCHFIQKLEDQPEIEFLPFHPDYTSAMLGRDDSASEHFQRWAAGQTGYPFLDACMRALQATGWINFRMRAMLVSFVSYHLWQDWRAPALHLARLFTDYEPGIHYPQIQMQSGTTGINTLRIYNPIKQGHDQDPQGLFIRRWVPELAEISDMWVHTPWLAPTPPSVTRYPPPLVDEARARKEAATRLYGIRRSETHRARAATIVKKHGSRTSGLPKFQTKARHKNKMPNTQGELF